MTSVSCVICSECLDERVVTKCNHNYCQKCYRGIYDACVDNLQNFRQVDPDVPFNPKFMYALCRRNLGKYRGSAVTVLDYDNPYRRTEREINSKDSKIRKKRERRDKRTKA